MLAVKEVGKVKMPRVIAVVILVVVLITLVEQVMVEKGVVEQVFMALCLNPLT